MRHIFAFLFILLSSTSIVGQGDHSIARAWNDVTLESIRNDFARPTVHARNLFHTSIAMYDIWSVVYDDGDPYLLGDTVGTYISRFAGLDVSMLTDFEKEEYVNEAISHAMFQILTSRFRDAPGAFEIFEEILILMDSLNYNQSATSGVYPEDQSALAFGRYVASEILAYGDQDGSNEFGAYENLYYEPQNNSMLVGGRGNKDLLNPNRWQPLAFDIFIDQSGNEIIGNAPDFLSPEWGNVTPFALEEEDSQVNMDARGNAYIVYKDPGSPPQLSETAQDSDSELYKWGFVMVAIWSSMLDPEEEVLWDISPNGIGNVTSFPAFFEDYDSFYDYYKGGDAGLGHSVNPITNEPYERQMVPLGDYARVLAEFWADGPDSETPPGHWYTILHSVMDHPEFERKWEGQGGDMSALEYDVRAFFTLGGAMHDAAVATWSIKGWYDYIRPISVIRYMASKGQSTDTLADNYDVHGLPLIENFIEVITEDDDELLRGPRDVFLGDIKVRAWRGPSEIEDPTIDVAGVGWIRAEEWWPYQRPTFVSPPFAGYTSGHSCFSRAAAEVLTKITGSEYFPGGIGIFKAPKDNFLVFEKGPSVDIELQWATYYDAADQSALSRIWGGIHPPQDDIPGRIIGREIGVDAFNKASEYFSLDNTSTYTETLVTGLFDVYPNPLFKGQRINIDFGNTEEAEVHAEIYTQSGSLMRREQIKKGQQLEADFLSPGVYYLHLIGVRERQITKVVILE